MYIGGPCDSPLFVVSTPLPLFLRRRGACETGLRTLLTAKTERSEEKYSAWLVGFQAAEISMQGREEKVRSRAVDWPTLHTSYLLYAI